MTPRLLLLTGPAAGDVANALNPDDCERCDVSMDPCSLCPVRLGFEVRDYLAAPARVALMEHDCRHTRKVEAAIRSLPGGEAWLVGLVLPDTPYQAVKWGFKNAVLATQNFGCGRVKQTFGIIPDPNFSHGPARLAILAPEPPPLLVERVRAWGGEVWECEIAPPEYGKPDSCWIVLDNDVPSGTTWPEAVRAALGEAAPCA